MHISLEPGCAGLNGADIGLTVHGENSSVIVFLLEMIAMNEDHGADLLVPHHEETVDLRTAATFLRISCKTLERMARRGEVPADKPGKSWQFLLSLLSEWRKERMNSNVVKHTPTNNHR